MYSYLCTVIVFLKFCIIFFVILFYEINHFKKKENQNLKGGIRIVYDFEGSWIKRNTGCATLTVTCLFLFLETLNIILWEFNQLCILCIYVIRDLEPKFYWDGMKNEWSTYVYLNMVKIQVRQIFGNADKSYFGRREAVTKPFFWLQASKTF